MDIYYIDYENVNSFGLKGVQLLNENSQVNILYSKKADNVKIDALTQLLQSKAEIHFLPVHVGTPNALDFQLVTLLFLGYREGNRYFIISKDSGYDCCIRTARENGAANVWRFQDIETALSGARSAGLQPVNAPVHTEAPVTLPAPASQPESAESAEAVSAKAAPLEISSVIKEELLPENADGNTTKKTEENAVDAVVENQAVSDEETRQSLPDGTAQHRSRRRRRSSRKPSQVHTDLQTPEQKNLPQQSKEEDRQDHGSIQSPDSSLTPAADAPVRFPAAKVSEVISRRCGFTPDEKQLFIISDVLRKANNKQQFYSSIVRRCGQKEGLALYHTIRCAYNDLLAIEAG